MIAKQERFGQTSPMQSYPRRKLRTALEIIRSFENWPSVLALRLRRHGPRREALLAFRDGLTLACRRGTRDWDVVHEIVFAGGYARALDHLGTHGGTVLDLGGNLGVFSLLCARRNTEARIIAYEPGPPNCRLFEINCLLNPALAERIELRKVAVGGVARTERWIFDEANPGGSGLYAPSGPSFAVPVVPFAEAVRAAGGAVALAKIDIEGAEYELLEHTEDAVWANVGAVALELHDDPRGRSSPAAFLARMRELGFTVEEESVISHFLHRA